MSLNSQITSFLIAACIATASAQIEKTADFYNAAPLNWSGKSITLNVTFVVQDGSLFLTPEFGQIANYTPKGKAIFRAYTATRQDNAGSIAVSVPQDKVKAFISKYGLEQRESTAGNLFRPLKGTLSILQNIALVDWDGK